MAVDKGGSAGVAGWQERGQASVVLCRAVPLPYHSCPAAHSTPPNNPLTHRRKLAADIPHLAVVGGEGAAISPVVHLRLSPEPPPAEVCADWTAVVVWLAVAGWLGRGVGGGLKGLRAELQLQG